MTIKFLAVARSDLREAVQYYNVQRPGLGKELRDEVRAAVGRIRNYPEGWQRLSENTRRCLLARFPYGIIYRVGDKEIVIVAVAHLHREPDHWKDRLPDSE